MIALIKYVKLAIYLVHNVLAPLQIVNHVNLYFICMTQHVLIVYLPAKIALQILPANPAS